MLEETTTPDLAERLRKLYRALRLVGSEGRLEQRAGMISIWVNGKLEWFRPYRGIDQARAAGERIAAERG